MKVQGKRRAPKLLIILVYIPLHACYICLDSILVESYLYLFNSFKCTICQFHKQSKVKLVVSSDVTKKVSIEMQSLMTNITLTIFSESISRRVIYNVLNK